MFPRKTGMSLEDTIKNVQKKYKNRASPLALIEMQQNVGYIPTHVPDMMKPKDPRAALLGNFTPPNDTFR